MAPPEASYTISVHGGSDQQGPAGSLLDEPLQVTVVDVANQPVQGVVVRFRALGGGGSLTDSIGVTGPGGVALTFARVGAAVGPQQFEAALRRAPARKVTFEATATDPARLIRISAGSPLIAGDTVDIVGENFNTNPGGNTVFFGTTRARILSVEGDTLLRVIVPFCVSPGATAVHVQVGSAVTNTLSVSYAPTSPTLQLAVGEGITVGVADLQRCLQLPGSGPRYLVVPQFASTADDPIFTPFKIGWTSTVAALAAPPAARSATAPLFTRRATAQARVDGLMRDIEREIAPQLAGQDNEQESLVLEALALNTARSFRVISDLGEEGKSPTFGTSVAQLRYIGEHVLIYIDQRSVATISEAEMTRIGLLFDTRLYDRAVERFGSESDLDGNGKVIVLMTPFVNGLVTREECQAESFVAGYFYPNDLFLRNANSNKGEIFYTIVPDPTGAYSCPQGAAFVRRLIPGTFIHEFQHMISFNQHVLARGGSSEDVWLNEGLSLIAEEAAARYYEALPPAVAPGEILTDSAAIFLEEILVHAYDYLATSKSYSVTTFDGFGDLEERAAAWLFLRWLGDQRGEGIYARLVQTRATSIENVQRQTGENFSALFGDFSLALAADIPDIPNFSRTTLSPRYRFAPRPDGRTYRTIFERIQLKYGKATPTPVVFSPVRSYATSPTQSSMVQGTMAFFSLTTATIPQSSLGLLFTGLSGEPLPAALVPQVGIVRVQ